MDSDKWYLSWTDDDRNHNKQEIDDPKIFLSELGYNESEIILMLNDAVYYDHGIYINDHGDYNIVLNHPKGNKNVQSDDNL